ncbi:hypothetical protein SUGI_0993350 [Cryptomeria japonica]|nr:hypothetical protein SUGI_0993350 [Cryptomeria japonica]
MPGTIGIQNKKTESDTIEIDLTEEVDEDRHILDTHATIARMPRKIIRTWVDKNWGKHIVIKFLPKNFFVVVFKDGMDRDYTLDLKNWFLDTYPLYIQPWAPNFDPTSLVEYETLVWIRLFNLPIEYWSDQSLEKIGRTLGILLEIDEGIIERDLYTYARLKIAAAKKIPQSITLLSMDGEWTQNIAIEKEIKPCTKCGSRLHQTESCRIFVKKAFNRPQRNPKKVWRRKENIPPQEGQGLEVIPLKVQTYSTPQNISQTPSEELANKSSNKNQSDKGIEPKLTEKEAQGNQEEDLEGQVETCSENSEPTEDRDELDILDPRCISQSANTFLGRSKGMRGRRSHRMIREQREKEKGIISILDYMKVPKGGNPSLGER